MNLYKKELTKKEIEEIYNNGESLFKSTSMADWIYYKNEWIHIAMVHNGITGKTYVNGKLENSK
jgi:hypothetical protein